MQSAPIMFLFQSDLAQFGWMLKTEETASFFGAGIIFSILAHPVLWIIQEPNTLELWNKLHFEEKKTESIYHV